MLRTFLERFRPPTLTRERITAAYAVAITVDVLQLALGPAGWFFADQLLDALAAILIWRLIGFHLLLLPTFVLEFVPLVDMVPTWTGCVAMVVAMRKRRQAAAPKPPLSSGRVIDI
jgi:hypothetical protein